MRLWKPAVFAAACCLCASLPLANAKDPDSPSAPSGQAAALPADSPVTSNEPPQKAADEKPTLSPLHSFLGIDPTTDSFTRPVPRKKTAPKNQAKAAATPSAAPAADPSRPATATAAVASTAPASDALTDGDEFRDADEVEKLRASLAKVLENGDQSSLAALMSSLPQPLQYERLMETNRRYAPFAYALLLIYPLAIVCGEMFQWFLRRRDPLLAERDRRYHASRMRRRVLLAAALTATVALLWWGSVNNYWWERPRTLAAFATGMFVLVALMAVLRMVIRRAAARYPVLVIRELQEKQLKLQAEVEELRQRLHSFRFAGGI